jgi:hypothetical protein
MAGLAEAFRTMRQPVVPVGGGEPAPLSSRDYAGRIYRPDIIEQEQNVLRGGQLMQSEDGQQYMLPQTPMGWFPWLNWMLGRR